MERVEPSQLHNSIQESLQSNVTVLPQAFGGSERGQSDADAQDRSAADFKAIPPQPPHSGAAFLVAGLFSLFWIGGILAYLSGYLGQGGMDRIPASWWGILAAVLAIPTAMAWFVAYVIRESRLLRLQAQGLATAAAALLQPDDHASRGVNKLGRTLRRELDNFNVALEAAMGRMAQLEATNAQRLEQLEKAAAQAQDRVEKAAGKLGSERDKFQAFTQSLDASVMQVNESLTARVQEARVAARAAADSLQTEQTAILNLIEALKTSAMQASAQASEAAKEVERQSQRLDSAAEAAAARSEQVMARHERHRAALTDTLERLRSENDHMTKALEAQRDAFSKLTLVMGEEAKRIDAFAGDGLRRIDQATAQLSSKIQTFAADSIQRIDTATAALGERVSSVAAATGETLAGATKSLDAHLLGVSQTAARSIEEAGVALETRMAALQTTATRSVDEATARAAIKLEELNKATAITVAEASQLLGQRFNDVNKSAIQSIDGSAAILAQRIAQVAETGNKSLEASVASLAQKISEISNQSGVKTDAAMATLSSRIAEFSSDTMRKLEASAGALSQKILETAKAFAVETEKLRNQSEAAALSLDKTARTVRSSGEAATAVSSTLNEELKNVHALASETSERIEAGLISLKKLMSDLPAEAAGHVEALRSMVDGQAAQILDLSARVHQAFEQIQMIEMHRQAWAAVPAPGAPMRQPAPQPVHAMPQPPVAAPMAVAQPRPVIASPSPAATVPPPASAGSGTTTDSAPRASNSSTGSSDGVASVTAPPAVAASAQGPQAPAEVRSWLNLAKRLVRITGGDETEGTEQQPKNWDIKQLLAAAESPAPQLDSATATRHMMETLQAMAIDLDRLIEDEPPLELLRRYRSGERNIFARRLVQILGRDQNERIMRKYKSDPEFLETVDRYCQQFEALMDEAASKDREGIMAETFLTSQTGKVYLFLASAIGRIH